MEERVFKLGRKKNYFYAQMFKIEQDQLSILFNFLEQIVTFKHTVERLFLWYLFLVTQALAFKNKFIYNTET